MRFFSLRTHKHIQKKIAFLCWSVQKFKMGTNCALNLSDPFLPTYESEFLQIFNKNKKIILILHKDTLMYYFFYKNPNAFLNWFHKYILSVPEVTRLFQLWNFNFLHLSRMYQYHLDIGYTISNSFGNQRLPLLLRFCKTSAISEQKVDKIGKTVSS